MSKRKSRNKEQTMALPKNDVRGKVQPETHIRIKMRALALGVSMEKVVSDSLDDLFLGVGHRERLAAERMHRLGLIGNGGD